MEQHDLRSLAGVFGDSLVNLQQFAALCGVSPSGLRSRGRRDDTDPVLPAFPAPIVSSSGAPQFRLHDLVEWFVGTGAPPAKTPPAVAEWALDEALARCAAELGSDTAVRIVAATALALVGGWAPQEPTAPGAGKPVQYAAQVRAALRNGLTAPSRPARLPTGFVPDPDPVVDPVVCRQLAGPSTFGRATRSGAVEALIVEVARIATDDARNDFATVVERRLLPRTGELSVRRRAPSGTETDLLVAIAHVRPGQVFLDPAVGFGDALVAAVDRTATADGVQTIGVVGRELDARTWLLTKVRLGLRGIAHQLGSPGVDAIEDPTLTGPFDRILVDPDTGAQTIGRWCERVVALLGPDGLAVVRSVAADVRPPARTARRGWWDEVADSVAAIVVTARYPSSPGGSGMLVLRPSARRPVLFVQVYSPPPERPVKDGPTREQWVDALGALVAAGTDPAGDVAAGWHGTTYVTLLDDLSVEALGGLDDDDLEVVQRWKEDSLGIVRPPPAVRESAASAPSRNRRHRKPVLDDPIRWEALRSVTFLRALLDPLAPPPEDPRLQIDPEDRVRYAAEVTEEIRRALQRLEQRLRGEETRGRPRRSDPG